MAWAFKKTEPVAEAMAPALPTPSYSYVPPPQPRSSKKRPLYAEEVLAEAIKCKHRGSDLSKAS